ncbi:MAG TPA: PQQ-binding-like beta-propeller repeat protein [Rhizomicrobium sp.]
MHSTNSPFRNRRLRGAVSIATLVTVLAGAAFSSASPALAANLATTSLKVSPAVDHPSASVKASGKGFAANEAVDVYFDTTDEILAVTDSSGAFRSYPMPVPADALPGTHWITAVGRKDGVAAQKSFTVRTDWPEIGFSPRGTRDNPYENVLSSQAVSSLDLAWVTATGQYINSSPAVANGNVYVTSNDHNLYAFNGTTGAKLWSATLGDYSNSSPAVADRTVYVGANDGKLYAFDARNGSSLWSYATGAAIESSPAIAGNIVYVGSDDGNLYAFDAKSGAKLWSNSTGKVTASPTVAYGTVYVDAATGLFAYNAATGAALWNRIGFLSTVSPAVANGLVYIDDNHGYFEALDATNGYGIWASQSIGSAATSAAVANGAVYACLANGLLYAFNAATGAVLWSAPLGEINSSPAVADGVVYVSVASGLFALDAATGVILWSEPTESFTGESSPTVANGMVYVGSTDFNLYAFALDGGGHAAYRRNAEPPAPPTLQPDWRLQPAR